MDTTQPNVEGLADELVRATPRLDEEQQRAALALYRLLANGEPVAREQLPEPAGASESQLERLLGHPGVAYFDDQDRLIGFWGMALSGMPHRVRVDGRTIRAWCAWDTLFLPSGSGSPSRSNPRARAPATPSA